MLGVVVVVVVIGVRFFLSCACRRVPVSRGARSGFKNRHTPFLFLCSKDAKHADRVFFDRAGTFFFFQTSIKKNSPPFFWLILSKNTHK